MRRLRIRLLRRFVQLSWPERTALFRASFLLVLARSALTLLPLRTVLRNATRERKRPAPHRDEADLRRMCWAIEAVGNRLFPRNPCLTQAIVVQWLFLRAGRPAELRIGVHKEHASHLNAHAWVESGDEIVIGQKGLTGEFIPLPPIRSGPAKKKRS